MVQITVGKWSNYAHEVDAVYGDVNTKSNAPIPRGNLNLKAPNSYCSAGTYMQPKQIRKMDHIPLTISQYQGAIYSLRLCHSNRYHTSLTW